MTQKSNKPYVIQYNGDFGGCGFWRFLWPQYVLNIQNLAEVCHNSYFIRDLSVYRKASVVHLQRQGFPEQYTYIKALADLRERYQFRIVYDADDILFGEDQPLYNKARKDFSAPSIRESVQSIIELADEMTVTTPFLRDYYKRKTSQKSISVIPNYPPLSWIGSCYSETRLLTNYEKHKSRPRIIYAGGTSHIDLTDYEGTQVDDFSHVRKMIIETRHEFMWVFVGVIPVSFFHYVEKGEMEYHSWVTKGSYPSFLTLLEGNMMVAPLAENDFNRGKSNLKWLESSALGLPIACQDMETYPEATIRFKTGEEMIERIRETLSSKESFMEAARLGHSSMMDKWLELDVNIGKYYELYTTPYGSPDRKRLF